MNIAEYLTTQTGQRLLSTVKGIAHIRKLNTFRNKTTISRYETRLSVPIL